MADNVLLVTLQDLLTAAEGLYPATDPAAPLLPDRRYYHVGTPADDLGENCESSLVVYALRVVRGQPGASQGFPVRPRAASALTNQVEAHVRLIRCVPVFATAPKGSAPAPADIETAHSDLLYDGRILWHGLYDLHRAGELLSDCVLASFGPMVAVTPSGGVAGWDLTLGIDF